MAPEVFEDASCSRTVKYDVYSFGILLWELLSSQKPFEDGTLHCAFGITGSALALHCCKAHAKINGKIKNLTPCKIVTNEDFNLKLGTRDYVVDATHHATLGSNRPSGGFPPNRGNITPVFFLDPAPRSNRRTDCYAEWLK